jgi:hypothetical protein
MTEPIVDSLCAICLEAMPASARKTEMFGCNCQVYFHQKCWELFCESTEPFCPYCRATLVVPGEQEGVHTQPARNPFNGINGWLLIFLGCCISMFSGCFVVGLTQVSLDDEYAMSVIITSVSVLFVVLLSMVCFQVCSPDSIMFYVYLLRACIFCLFIYVQFVLYQHRLDDHIITLVGACIFTGTIYVYLLIRCCVPQQYLFNDAT